MSRVFDYKGVIFDVDGVLLDSMSIWEDLGLRYIKSFGLTPEEGLSKKLFSMSMEQGSEYLASNYPLNKTVEDILKDLHTTLQDFYFYEVQAKAGAEEFIKTMASREIKMTAATSSPRSHVTKALERVGLLSYIDSIFTTTEVGESKHSPLVYHKACESMGLEVNETIVCEDSLYALKTAKSAGYFTIGVFDAAGEKDQDGLKENSDIYVMNLAEAL